VPLAPEGEAQGRALRTALAAVDPAFVLCSPRSRALRTAQLAGLRIDAVDPDAAEWDYGDYEGLTTPQIRVEAPGWTIWSGSTPGGETPAEVGARADRVLERIRPHLGHGPVVIVAHGHFNRVLAARWIGLDPAAGAHLLLDTAAPCLLGEERGTPAIRHWNMPLPGAAAPEPAPPPAG